MGTIHELRGFQRDLLFVINGLDDPNGQEVLGEMNRAVADEIQHGRLYSNLDDLVEMGLVEKAAKNGRTNRYTLTPAGREILKSRREWERHYLEIAEST